MFHLHEMQHGSLSHCFIGIICSFTGGFSNPCFHSLLQKIQTKMESGNFRLLANPVKRNLLRIAILSLGSPLWAQNSSDLPLFCYCLRAMLRSAYAVCLITVPSHLCQVISSYLFDCSLQYHVF